MGLKLKNIKETILLGSFIYVILSIIDAILKSLFQGDTGLSFLLMPLYLIFQLFFAGIVVICFVFISKKKELFYFPNARFLLVISLVLTVISIIIQLYNPLIMAVSTSNSDTSLCDAMIDVNSPMRILMGPDGLRWVYYSDKCIQDIAIKEKDSLICNEIKSSKSIRVCIINLASITGDAALCEEILEIYSGDENNGLGSNRNLAYIGCLRNFNSSISYSQEKELMEKF
jgi:hypothetical protein